MRASLIGGALLTSACAAMFRAPVSRGSAWIQVRTPHFALKTSLQPDQALETAEYLERTRTAMLNAAWGGSKGPPGVTEVVVFARATEFARFATAYSAGETRAVSGYEPTIVFSRNTRIGMASIGAHELAHQLSSWYMPLQPRWLAEGVATFLETIRVDKQTGIAYVGAPPAERVAELGANEAFDTEQLFAAGSPGLDGVGQIPHFYAQSWVLLHYLIEEQQAPFARFQRRLRDMTDWRSAFDWAMPEGLSPGPELNERLARHWADRKNWPFVAAKPVVLEVFEPTVTRMSQANVHGLFAWLSLPDRDVAEREVNEALRLDPNELYALRTQLYGLPTSADGRDAIARRALVAHPNDIEAWLMAIDALKSDAEARAAIQRAKQLDVNHPRLQARIGFAHLRARNAKAALPHLSYALHRLIPNRALLAGYVEALLANGRCIEARQIAESTPPHFSELDIAKLRERYAALKSECVPSAP